MYCSRVLSRNWLTHAFGSIAAMAFFRISITTSMDRNQAITEVRNAIIGRGGWIVDHTLFSNLSANLNFELPGDQAADLVTTLEAARLRPAIEGEMPGEQQKDLRGQVALTFIHQVPDLKRDVPAFG